MDVLLNITEDKGQNKDSVGGFRQNFLCKRESSGQMCLQLMDRFTQ